MAGSDVATFGVQLGRGDIGGGNPVAKINCFGRAWLTSAGVILSMTILSLGAPAGANPPHPLVDHASNTSCSGTLPAGTVVGMAGTEDDGGYWVVNNRGLVVSCGDAPNLGGLASAPNNPIVGIAATATGNGYYLVASDGGIFTFGDAIFQGSTGALKLNKPVVGMAIDPTTGGYWLVASDGGIFSFKAPFEGSTGAIVLNKPVVGMATDAATGGYWLVASDGGIFSFQAPFYGSTGALVLNRPIVGMEANRTGTGYRFVASDGGIFDFGSSGFFGSAVAPPPNAGASCTVSLSNSSPADEAVETATITSTVPDAAVTLTKMFKTTTSTDHGTTSSNGSATLQFNIGSATAGFRVAVTVNVGSETCSTGFTPV